MMGRKQPARPGAPRWHSALYTGTVRHRRAAPIEHAFTYRHAMVLLDLAELPDALDMAPLASATGVALARFRREDFLSDPARPLDASVRDLVEERTGTRPAGPIRLLTTLRTFGRAFNPVSFYYCFDGDRVESVVADVTNTPWGERHAYVLDRDESEHGVMRDTMDKAFHVSPFIGMDGRYDWRVTEPGERLLVHIDETDAHTGAHVFDATLSLERRPLTRSTMARHLARFPATSARVGALIYWNALKLKLKGAPYFPNPSGAPVRRSKRAARAKEKV